MKKYAVALATTAALVGVGCVVPQAGAQNETAAHAVAGLTWPNLEIKAGETKTLSPNTAPGEDIRVVGPGDSAGFRFSTNKGTGAITVTAPVDAYPGSTYSLPIQVHGKDGKIGEFTSTVTIVAGGDNQATKFPVSYDQVTVKEKGSATVARTGGVPDGTTFTVIGQPSGYTVTVDGSGSVTVKPAANLGAGSTGTARIKVTYPDTSYEYETVRIAVSDESGNTTPRADRDTAKYEPTWAPIAMKGDEAATSERSGDAPAGTTFKIREDLLGELTQSIAFTIDETSGTITVTPQKPLRAGLELNIPVQVTYPDGSSETLLAPMKVTEDGQWQAAKATVEYTPITTPAGTAGTSTPSKENVPAGTKFSLGTLPEGWSGAVDKESGELTVTAPRGGMKADIPVTAVFPDGSKQTYRVPFATTALAQTAPVKYEDATVTTGNSVTLSASEFPAGTKFDGPNQDTQGITITTNTETGEINVAAAANAAGQTLTIPVRVTFPDKTFQDTTAKVTIQRATTSTTPASPAPTSTSAQPTTTTPVTTPATTSTTQPSTTHRTTPTSTTPTSTSAQPTPTTSTSAQPTPTTSTTSQAPVVLDVNWDDSDVLAGETVNIEPKGDFPEGTQFRTGGIRGWDVSVDDKTGVISATIPAGTNPGSHASPVIIAYLPDSSAQVERRVKLTVAKQSEHYSPAYPENTRIAGDEEVTIKTAGDVPAGTTFELIKPASGPVWTISVDKSTGIITFKPTKPMRAGSATTVEVRATFPDGSRAALEAGVAITEDAAALAPTSTPTTTAAQPSPTTTKTTAKSTPKSTPTTTPKATKPTVTISTTITPTWTLPVPTDLPTTSKKPTTGNQTPTVPTPGTTTQTPTDTNSTDTNSADTTQNDGSSGSSEGSSISTGGIIGIVLGVLAALGAAAALGWWAAENGYIKF